MPDLQQLITMLILLSGGCFAQVASVSKLTTAGGFLVVCGTPDTQLSKSQTEALMKVSPSQLVDQMGKEMADRTTEVVMCFGYVAGLIEGWKDGHEHGVIAAQFPDAWPKDEKKALSALPINQLHASQGAMTTDVPCIPDYVTIGQERDIIVKYMRNSEKQGNFLLSVDLTSHMMWLAFQEAFPCSAQPAKQSPAVK